MMSGLPIYASPLQRVWYYAFRVFCGLVFFFLIFPILVIIPLSFNPLPYFTFTREMIMLDPAGYSWINYQDFFTNPEWQRAVKNSFLIAPAATLLSTVLGTLAAIGLSRPHVPFRRSIMAIMISPMIVPLIITAAGIFFFYASLNEFVQLTGSFIGIVLAHTVLGTPFVVITVTATLIGFDQSLVRAGLMCGATPTRVFFKVVLPLILPGVISGALFAFVTSFDEIVVVLFVGSVEYQTIPRQMWAGIREEISPIILAVATLLICLSTLLMIAVEMLRRYNERQRGVRPG